jgi:hypothetical protein
MNPPVIVQRGAAKALYFKAKAEGDRIPFVELMKQKPEPFAGLS